jgi:hypothetical protein
LRVFAKKGDIGNLSGQPFIRAWLLSNFQ